MCALPVNVEMAGEPQDGKDVFALCDFSQDDCDNSDSSQPATFAQESFQDNASHASETRRNIWMTEGGNKLLSHVQGQALKWLS